MPGPLLAIADEVAAGVAGWVAPWYAAFPSPGDWDGWLLVTLAGAAAYSAAVAVVVVPARRLARAAREGEVNAAIGPAWLAAVAAVLAVAVWFFNTPAGQELVAGRSVRPPRPAWMVERFGPDPELAAVDRVEFWRSLGLTFLVLMLLVQLADDKAGGRLEVVDGQLRKREPEPAAERARRQRVLDSPVLIAAAVVTVVALLAQLLYWYWSAASLHVLVGAVVAGAAAAVVRWLIPAGAPGASAERYGEPDARTILAGAVLWGLYGLVAADVVFTPKDGAAASDFRLLVLKSAGVWALAGVMYGALLGISYEAAAADARPASVSAELLFRRSDRFLSGMKVVVGGVLGFVLTQWAVPSLEFEPVADLRPSERRGPVGAVVGVGAMVAHALLSARRASTSPDSRLPAPRTS